MNYNKTILGGNLTRDIEIKYTQGGTAIGSTGIAVTKKYKSATGEQKEKVLFIDLKMYGRTAEIANQYLRKGSQVLVDGEIELDQWTAQDGTKKSRHSVKVDNLQMIGGRREAQQIQEQPIQPAPQPQNQQAAMPEFDISQDEIPFVPISKRLSLVGA